MTQKLKFCDYLLTLMSFQSCMTFFLIWNRFFNILAKLLRHFNSLTLLHEASWTNFEFHSRFWQNIQTQPGLDQVQWPHNAWYKCSLSTQSLIQSLWCSMCQSHQTWRASVWFTCRERAAQFTSLLNIKRSLWKISWI